MKEFEVPKEIKEKTLSDQIKKMKIDKINLEYALRASKENNMQDKTEKIEKRLEEVKGLINSYIKMYKELKE